jgi:hypothetical protein
MQERIPILQPGKLIVFPRKISKDLVFFILRINDVVSHYEVICLSQEMDIVNLPYAYGEIEVATLVKPC